MKAFEFSYLITLIVFLICACNNQEVRYTEKPPKVIFDTDSNGYCDTLRRHTYERLNNGIIELVTNYPTPSINNDIEKVRLFDRELKKRYGMEILEVYDSFFYNHCIIPIMDSVIISKYGPNGKAKIIEEITNYVESVYSVKK
ncbi:MAG: hypothetical protein ACOYMA_02825 [Bacteroidia bacterium]